MSTEKDNPKSERDPLLERFQKACSSITPVVRKKDPLFAEFADRYLWFFYYNGYRQITWMIEACLDPDLLRSLFRYHWDNNLSDLPSGEVLMRAMRLTFHDALDLPRKTVTDHLEECFRDALEELRAKGHLKEREKEKGVVTSFPSPPGLRWEDVTIAFISDNEIRVEAKGLAERFSYDEIGFDDKRDRGKGNLWLVFRALAMLQGSATVDNLANASKDRDNVSKDISRLKKILYRLMGIKGDPFYNFKKHQCYQTRFQLRDEQMIADHRQP